MLPFLRQGLEWQVPQPPINKSSPTKKTSCLYQPLTAEILKMEQYMKKMKIDVCLRRQMNGAGEYYRIKDWLYRGYKVVYTHFHSLIDG